MTNMVSVAIGAASGAIYARYVLKLLNSADTEVNLIISVRAEEIIKAELGIDSVKPETIAGVDLSNVTVYAADDLFAPISSGSVKTDGMIICPCSSNSLAAIAAGTGENLIHRAAYVTMKQRKPLVLVHREAPLTAIDIDNMKRAASAGAIVFPASPTFYSKPESIDDLVCSVAGRAIELLGIDIESQKRWQGGY